MSELNGDNLVLQDKESRMFHLRLSSDKLPEDAGAILAWHQDLVLESIHCSFSVYLDHTPHPRHPCTVESAVSSCIPFRYSGMH